MGKLCYFQWKEPRKVKQWSRKIWQVSDFSFWGIVAFAVIIGWTILVNGIFAFIGCVILSTILAWVPTTYMIAPEGVRIESGFSRDWYRWENIERYRVESSSLINPNIASLSFKVKKRPDLSWTQFYFDRNEIDEVKLRGVLQQHLPDKELAV